MMISKLRPLASSLLIAVTLSALASSCAKTSDQAKVEDSIARLKSGEVVRAIEEKNALSEEQAVAPSGVIAGPEFKPATVEDPCGDRARVSIIASDESKHRAMIQLGECMREQLTPVIVRMSAFNYFKNFKMDSSERPLSTMTAEEAMQFLRENYADPRESFVSGEVLPDEQIAKLRGSFDDEELKELVALAMVRHDSMVEAQSKIFAAIDARRHLVETYAKAGLERYRILLALRDNVSDTTGAAAAKAFLDIIREKRRAAPEKFESVIEEMFYPYAFVSLIPDEGAELNALTPGEMPLGMIQAMFENLGGPERMVNEAISVYAKFNKIDNPAMPEHAPAAADAVRVAVLDTGVDYVSFPDLGLFLGNGAEGQIASGDFADGDGNPFLPAVERDGFSHGTGTTATVLTILAHHAPEILRERKLDLAVWKVRSIRSLLSFPLPDSMSFMNRLPLHQGLLARAMSENEVAPKIVSVSMGFNLSGVMNTEERQQALKKAPWLWVMAAGNSGQQVEESTPASCFMDVDASLRADERVLCVGALKRGIVNDKVADYSNYGDRVDVYAYESYIDLCPNGTSCSTPSVAGAAAAVAAKYPSLSSEQIKQVIVQASEERELEIDFSNPTMKKMAEMQGKPLSRKVRVLDPQSMMPKVLEIAKSVAQ